ncbi:TrlF family AAA-like ATPase [Tunturibacter empetritectus]|uniref:Type III restriction enzyme n=1 Tax=Tunturiibacter empetritectus TaxID=3069691 RepID=A0A7W8INB7_9BACT|nr:hypothetical protein [Edaphobacter lichenicola]MBB5319476.1 type III restriction enzyme [Edaphobacter lichenicola]
MHYRGLMDNGAHFFACDFQVHSPRDRNWIGACPGSEEERATYAKSFIAACRTKQLDAVAITDHHDVVFVEYIRAAAQQEVEANGTPVPAHKQIVVFPGVELTLATPCQAILLFDPECTAAELNAALTILGVTPSPATEPKTCETKRLDPSLTLGEICERLSNNAQLKGRFILLPNVNDGGDDTLLRTGFFQHYIDMPCVGGYVDGSFVGHKKNLVVSGKDTQWGSKKIGVFQTSDNRQSDLVKLGEHRTWVKWSHPSAEALRQACLAPSSRLGYTEPSLPQSWIKSMNVSDSQYFGPFKVEFNSQTNMAIGGRGSGKSTLLEYLRWGLCDQPVSINEDGSEEVPNYEKRRGSLIRSTLQKSHGTVTIEYMISGVSHLIRRDAVTEKVFLAIEGEPEQEVAQAVIQGLARVQGYSQKQLSNVSVRSSELLRLVTSPIKADLDYLAATEQECASKLRSCFQNKVVHKALTAQRAATLTELTSKRSQVDALNAGIGDLPPEHKSAIEEHAAFLTGQRTVESYISTLDTTLNDVGALSETLEAHRLGLKAVDGAQPADFVASLRQEVASALDAARADILKAGERATTAKAAMAAVQFQAKNLYDQHVVRYTAATSQNAVIQGRLDQIRQTTTDADALVGTLDNLDKRLADLGPVELALTNERSAWKAIGDKEFELLAAQASALTAASKAELKVDVSKGKTVDHLTDALAAAIQGANVTREKIAGLIKSVGSSASPFDEWIAIVDEILLLVEAEQAGTPAITPKMAAAGFGTPELKRVANKLTATSAFELSLQRPTTHPSFSYRVANASYIPFEQASPGQQANALLSLLFGQAVGPLIIDQPEDDLDNATALQIAESIWSAKEKRQLIVASHNPNLLVIGDAELVLHCSHYSPPKPGIQVGISVEGGLDRSSVRDVVAKVMEGGKDAFRLRMNRYGF